MKVDIDYVYHVEKITLILTLKMKKIANVHVRNMYNFCKIYTHIIQRITCNLHERIKSRIY